VLSTQLVAKRDYGSGKDFAQAGMSRDSSELALLALDNMGFIQ
jgi:hypothetical protein